MPRTSWQHKGSALLAAVTLTAVLVGPGADRATAESTCEFSMPVSIDPGVGPQPNSGTFTSGGETGTIDCGAGAGTLGIAGAYGTKDPDSCGGAVSNGNEGNGHAVMKVPTADGPQSLEFDFTFVYGQPATNGGVVEGTFQSERFSGAFQLTPTAGDCFSAPVTKANVTGQGVLK